MFNQAIKQATNNNIPQSKVASKTHYAFIKKAIYLHTALQKINKVIRILQHTPNLNPIQLTLINTNIHDINKYANLSIPILTENLVTTEASSTFLLTLKQTQKTIYQARKLENNIAHTQKINNHILN